MDTEYAKNAKITKELVDIESIIKNFDTDITYQIQNTGGSVIQVLTVYNNDESTAQTNILERFSRYKHKSNAKVYLFCLSSYGSSVAITEMGD